MCMASKIVHVVGWVVSVVIPPVIYELVPIWNCFRKGIPPLWGKFNGELKMNRSNSTLILTHGFRGGVSYWFNGIASRFVGQRLCGKVGKGAQIALHCRSEAVHGEFHGAFSFQFWLHQSLLRCPGSCQDQAGSTINPHAFRSNSNQGMKAAAGRGRFALALQSWPAAIVGTRLK